MFSENLKQLIEASLVDGVLMPNERAILLKRAMLEGIDADEANLLIDAEVQKVKIQKQAKQPKVRKCPYCGEILPPRVETCPSCGNAVPNDEDDQSLDFFIKQMKRTLEEVRSCLGMTPMMVASVRDLRRRALKLYGNDPTVKQLAEEIDEELEFFRQEEDRRRKEEAERRKEEAEIRRLEAQGNARPTYSGGGGGSSFFGNMRGCQMGCLITFVGITLLLAAALFSADKDENIADQQYAELVGRLDSLKAEPLTIENYARKEAIAIDLIWVENNEYSSYEKRKKEAFEKLLDNYIGQLSTFYALNQEEIDNYNGYRLHNLDDEEKKEQQQNNVTTE